MIRYEVWPPRQTSGQICGPGPQGIKATHYSGGYPSGIEACCTTERSQHKNKNIAQEMVEWALASCRIEDDDVEPALEK